MLTSLPPPRDPELLSRLKAPSEFPRISNRTKEYQSFISYILSKYIKLLSITSPNIDRFSKFFRFTLARKFAIKISLQISPHLNGVATLPCEILMSEKQRALYAGVLFLSLRRRRLYVFGSSVRAAVRACVRACVRASVIHVVVLCFRDISSIC